MRNSVRIGAVACVAVAHIVAATAWGEPPPASVVERLASLDRMPSGVAVFGERVFVSLPRWIEDGDFTVGELVDGALVPYPTPDANDLSTGTAALHSVNGLHVDRRGWLWILDNARIDLGPAPTDAPKLVVWDTVREREVFRHVFSPAIAPPATSFLNDVVVDEERGFAYITETGMGGAPCLIVFDVTRDLATRTLEGHRSVIADPEVTMIIEGEPVLIEREGATTPWRVAANSIALSPDGASLYFGAMSSRTLYRVDTLGLRDARLTPSEVEAQVEAWGPKPISDGIATAPNGRLYFTDVEGSTVAVATDDGPPSPLVVDADFSFPVAVEVPGDGWIYFTTNQLHRSPLLRPGVDRRAPPFGLWRVRLP